MRAPRRLAAWLLLAALGGGCDRGGVQPSTTTQAADLAADLVRTFEVERAPRGVRS